MSTVKKESVKSVCEEAIRKGQGFGIVMNKLRKKFDKDDATYEKSIKYYASALERAGEINADTKAKYVGTAGRGNISEGASKASAKASKRKGEKSKAEADDKPTKKTRKPKAPKAEVDDKPAKKERKSKAEVNIAPAKKERKSKSKTNGDGDSIDKQDAKKEQKPKKQKAQS